MTNDDTLRAALAAARAYASSLRQWIATWKPHTRIIFGTFTGTWLLFVYTSGIPAGTLLLVMAATVIIGIIHLVRGEWRRPRYISPLTVCGNAAQRLEELPARIANRWYFPDIVTIQLHPDDHTELTEHFTIADVLAELTAAADDVRHRFHASTLGGTAPRIQIASHPRVRRGTFRIDASTHSTAPRAGTTRKMTDPNTAAHPGADAYLMVGHHTHRLTAGDLTIGRSHSCDLTLSDDPHVSRQHLQLTHHDGGWWCANLSRYGTLLNGHPLADDSWTPLDDGDTFTLGAHRHAPTAIFSQHPNTYRQAG